MYTHFSIKLNIFYNWHIHSINNSMKTIHAHADRKQRYSFLPIIWITVKVKMLINITYFTYHNFGILKL